MNLRQSVTFETRSAQSKAFRIINLKKDLSLNVLYVTLCYKTTRIYS